MPPDNVPVSIDSNWNVRSDSATARAVDEYNRQANAWELVWLLALGLSTAACIAAGRSRARR